MTSKRTRGSMFRMTPYLITVGLGISTAAHAAQTPADEVPGADIDASEQAMDDDERVEIPAATIDTNDDGVADAWDRNGDEKPDSWDTDSDGKPDLLDDDGDGEPD